MFEIIYHPLYGELNELEQPKPYFETYECPIRCKFTWEYLKQRGYALRDFRGTGIQTNSDMNLVIKKPKPLEKEDLYLVHSKYHVELVENFSLMGSGQIGNLVMATEDTMEISLLSAGGAYEAIKDVLTKKYSQSFAIIRPPGHHATAQVAEGLCVFNNIALAIHKIRKELNFSGKIAILDIDAHYGNGLAKIFYEDPDVLYSSIHEFDFENGEEGYFSEIGAGKGLGFNINFPIRLRSNDSYIKEYTRFIEPFLKKYKPEIIIIATGFDGHWADPIGNLCYSSKGYQYFARWLKELSSNICNSRVSFCLEGGYNLLMLPRLIEIIIKEFIDVDSKCKDTVIDEIPYSTFLPYYHDEANFKIEFHKQVDLLTKKLNKIWNLKF